MRSTRALKLLRLFVIGDRCNRNDDHVFGSGTQMGGVGITVFADQNFRGKSATFR